MTRHQKYGVISKIDQFGSAVPPGYEDKDETVAIDKFEEELLKYQANGKPYVSLIELGSNQAYYTALFHKVIGRGAVSVCIDTCAEMLRRTKECIDANGITNNTIIEGSIGRLWALVGRPHSCKPLPSLLAVINEHLNGWCDILHCDIDGGELSLLADHSDVITQNAVGTLFLYTHRSVGGDDCKFSTHEYCKYRMLEIGVDYDLVFEDKSWRISSDSLLIYKRK